MSKLKTFFSLFLTMFKVGLFTFGGGYAMIAVIEREITEKKKWLTHDEFLDVIAIAESTPGPLAVNTSTFVGYKKGGGLGALFSTLGVILPSFIIIFIISLFFDSFLKLKFVGYAFKGIQVAVAFLILSAGIRMFSHLKHTVFNIVLFAISITAMLLLTLFAVKFSTVFFILIAGFIGVIVYFIKRYAVKADLKKEPDKTNVVDEKEKK